jgi:hypothetical protein
MTEAYPKSLAEHRAERSGAGADWTPRDALVSLLREIDAGTIIADDLVIAWRTVPGPGRATSFFLNATRDPHVAVGMLADIQDRLLHAKE